jgi:hypothetical protein
VAQTLGPYVHYPARSYREKVENAHRLLQRTSEKWALGDAEPSTSQILQQILTLFVCPEFFVRRFPFAVDPDWLAWNDGVIAQLATAIADEHDFTLLTVLGDALEDAGCADSEVLEHCWSGSRHVLSCWVADLLLGRAPSSVRFTRQGQCPARSASPEQDHPGLRYEQCCLDAEESLRRAVAGWSEGDPEDPPTDIVVQQILRPFVVAKFLRPPWGIGGPDRLRITR